MKNHFKTICPNKLISIESESTQLTDVTVNFETKNNLKKRISSIQEISSCKKLEF